jgi:hypothetical protein
MAASTRPTSLGTPLSEQAIRDVNFFNGRLVTSRDMARTQQARQEGDARLGQGLGAGIVQGLEISIADAALRQVTISPGLSVSAAGQTLCLGAAQTLGLVPTADTAAAAASGSFGRCGVLSGGGYVAGNGLYLLTLAPQSVSEGKAPVLALEPGNARCNTDAVVEAVQLRLLRVDDTLLAARGLDANPIGAAAVSKWRSAVAYACFGYPALPNAHATFATAPAAGTLLDAMRPGTLTDCDVPLGLVYMTASAGITFVDAWSVRRRVAGAPASQAWSAWFGPGLEALGEAQLAQFQQQVAEIPTASLAGLKAGDWFSWLPPAGFLEASGARGIDGLVFLDKRKPARTVPLAPGDVRALLAQALRRDAVLLDPATSKPRFRLYRVDGGPQCFVREAPNAPHAEEVWLDGERARLPGVNDVQSAIDALRGRLCGELSVWPGIDVQGLVDNQKSGTDLHLCFEAGTYTFEKPLRLENLGHVVLQGHGSASLLKSVGGEATVLVNACLSCVVHDLALAGGSISIGKQELATGLLGALTVVGVPQVHIERVSVRCQEAKTAGAACIVVRQTARLEQATPVEAVQVLEPLDRAKLKMAVRILINKRAELPTPTHARIVDCDLLIGAAQIGILCVDNDLTDIRHNRLRTLWQFMPPERGIVVAGSRAAEVSIAHNWVSSAAQGIAIGLSQGDAPNVAPLLVQRASIAHNTVGIDLGERDLTRNRFGIFVGNADSLALENNRVVYANAAFAKETQLESIRLNGIYGLHLSVRANHMRGTPLGINFTPQAPLPAPSEIAKKNETRPCLWLFDANLAEQALTVLKVAPVAADLVIDRDNVTV